MTNAHDTHLSWYRTGLATAIASTAEDMRGVIEVTLTARFTALDQEQTPHAVRLIGPGDILGLDARAVVRTDPRPRANDFEPSNLAAIDLFEEDLPWRYSPKVPDGARLLPWLALVALVVLADGEYLLSPQGDGLPRVLQVHDAAVLPPADQAWAWAHTALHAEHANPADPQATAALLAADPAASCLRLIAGRKLRAGTSYRAFLVPTFEVGRQAGLPNDATRADRLAWPRAGAIKLPVYFE